MQWQQMAKGKSLVMCALIEREDGTGDEAKSLEFGICSGVQPG